MDHQRLHTCYCPYLCGVCNTRKTFRHTNNLNVHQPVFTVECTYRCDVNNNTFSATGSMQVPKSLDDRTKQIAVILVIKHSCYCTTYMYISNYTLGIVRNVVMRVIKHSLTEVSGRSTNANIGERTFQSCVEK
jgi:hypothetical protein